VRVKKAMFLVKIHLVQNWQNASVSKRMVNYNIFFETTITFHDDFFPKCP
jgi:hypothetical protein